MSASVKNSMIVTTVTCGGPLVVKSRTEAVSRMGVAAVVAHMSTELGSTFTINGAAFKTVTVGEDSSVTVTEIFPITHGAFTAITERDSYRAARGEVAALRK